MDNPTTEQIPPASEVPRRNILQKFLAIVVGGVVTTVPAVAGVLTYLNPLRKKGGSGQGEFVRIAALEAVPDDNLPRRFAVIADKVNAWTVERNVPIGSVFLKRRGDQIVAWNTSCPHLGCAVDARGDGSFACPCHDSTFDANGQKNPTAVSPRGLDALEVDAAALAQGEVRVKFQNFETGKEAKVVRA